MPIDFQVDVARRRVVATGAPPISDRDLTRYELDLAAHPDHGAGFDQLLDMREIASATQVTSAGIQLASHVAGEYADHVGGTKMAVVVAGKVAYGLARMFAAYSEGLMDVRVFRDLDDAVSWLDSASGERAVDVG